MKKNKRSESKKICRSSQLGNQGEDLAKQFVNQLGMTILETNWRWGKLEVDLICLYENTMHFIEVKTRQSAQFGHPEDFVDQAKMERLFQAANQYMYMKDYSDAFCFDIISVIMSPEQKIQFFEDAFFPTW